MTWLAEHARFVWSFLRHPRAVGALVPSSRWLAGRMTEGMGLAEAETVVEVGPGTGPFTAAVVRELRPGALFLAVELDPLLARTLAEKFPGVQVINDSAEHLLRHLSSRGRRSADTILSSLPWAAFPADLQGRLLGAIVEALRPGGRFATFAYVHAMWFPAARRFSRLLRSRFTKVARSRVVWRNLPPAIVYRGEK